MCLDDEVALTGGESVGRPAGQSQPVSPTGCLNGHVDQCDCGSSGGGDGELNYRFAIKCTGKFV